MEDKKPTEDTGDLAPNATVIHENFVLAQAGGEVKASFIVIAGGEIGMEIEVHGHGQVFGRSPLAHAVFPSPSVSRQHLRVDRVEEAGRAGFKLTDLGSSNGTLVNGAQVKEALLRNGDKVAMGEVVFKFVLEDAIEHAFHRQVHQLIHYDQLTGLLTMDSFRMRLDEHMRATGGDVRFVLAMTDLDGLKKVNDTHGHLAGRMVVREMGVMMRQALRPEDIAGLYGGDEAIVLYPRTTMDDAVAVAERLRATIEARVFEQDGNRFQVTISQGLAEWPRQGQTVQQIIAAADRALYAAKAAGRNRVMRAE